LNKVNKLQKVEIKGTKSGNLGAVPFIPDGTYILIYQHKRAGIGKYCEPTGNKADDYFGESPYLIFPQNVLDFEIEALELIKKLNPEDLNSEHDIVYICPDYFLNNIKDKIIWD
jgi:hypothetical protein